MNMFCNWQKITKILTRRDALKRGAIVAGASTMSTWLPRKSWAAKPQMTAWIISFFNPKADEIIQQQFNEFAEQANADVNVVIVPDPQMTSKLKAAVEEGNPPDLAMFFDTDYIYYRSTGQLLEVTSLLNEMRTVELFPSAIAGVEYEGSAFGLPAMMNPSPIHWRKDLLEEAGLDYPKDIFEFVEVCKKIQKAPSLYGAGFCLGRAGDGVQNIQNILWLFGGWMTKDEKTLSIDSSGTIEGLRFISKMYNEDRIIPPEAINWDNSGNNNAYQSKQVAFICNPAAVYSYLAMRDLDLMSKTGLSAFPAGPAGSYTTSGFRAYGVFRKARDPSLVKEAMRWIMEPNRHAYLLEASGGHGVPVYRHLVNNKFWLDHSVFNEFVKMPEYGFLIGAKSPPSPATAEVANAYIIPDMVQDVVLRGVRPAEAARKAHQRAQVIFDRYYK